MFADLRDRILTRRARVGIVGQGYVGLSLACAAAAEGFQVTGLDTDTARVERLAAGSLVVPGVDQDLFDAGIATGLITFTTDTAALAQHDVVLICVPTPVRDHTPDLSYVEGAARDLARSLSRGQLVVLESTTYPGTTDDVVGPILETSGLRAGTDFLLAYSPERIDPGNVDYGLRNTPKVVGGATPEATELAVLFYEQLIEKVVVVSSCRAAELAKLLENTFRHVNIALVNEMAMLCHAMDIDVWEVLGAASSKPFGFMSFTPGPGVGGHCIPVDPEYLAWQIRRDAGRRFRILEQAQDIDAQMPAYVADRIGHALNDVERSVKNAKILVLGVSYKPDVGDVRESPSIRVITHLWRRGADVSYHDPYVPDVPVNGHSIASIELTDEAIASADCVAILTPHSIYDLDRIADKARLIFDARNAFGQRQLPNVVRL